MVLNFLTSPTSLTLTAEVVLSQPPFTCVFSLFSCFSESTKTSDTIANGSGGSRYSYNLDFQGNACFECFFIRYGAARRLWSLCIRKFSSLLSSLRHFNRNHIKFCQAYILA